MKKTIQEEKQRFFEITRRLTNESLTGLAMLPGGTLYEVNKHMKAIRELCPNDDEFRRIVTSMMENILSNKDITDTDDEDVDGPPPTEQDTDEYHNQFNKNMSQGFTINEGNAFVGAAIKAKKEGKDSFKLGGKTYKVTVKKSENKK